MFPAKQTQLYVFINLDLQGSKNWKNDTGVPWADKTSKGKFYVNTTQITSMQSRKPQAFSLITKQKSWKDFICL